MRHFTGATLECQKCHFAAYDQDEMNVHKIKFHKTPSVYRCNLCSHPDFPLAQHLSKFKTGFFTLNSLIFVIYETPWDKNYYDLC